tara:strand:+ start:362 stop:856 length:495 start_codon:yes stop_codon:yes gene_type:complete
MIPVNLIISLGTSIFVALMVFLYFRNRVKTLEFKLNTMFQLIQDHVSKQKSEEKELIMVSDNEEYEEGDSSAESVTTEEEPVNIMESVEKLDEPVVDKIEITELGDESAEEESAAEESAAEEEVKTDYARLSVAALKKIAEERNLEKYKSLRKDDLINLIKSSE